MDIDNLLARSAPPVAPRTGQLKDDLRALVRESEPARRAHRRISRTAVGAGIVTGVLSLGVVGAAAVINDGAPWFTTTSAGNPCEMEFSVEPVGPEDAPNGEPAMIMAGRTHWPSAAEQKTTVAEARQFLAGFNYDAIDRVAAARRFDVDQRRIISAAPTGEAQPLLTGNDLETTAVGGVVFDALSAHLRAKGLSPYAVVTATGSSAGCSE